MTGTPNWAAHGAFSRAWEGEDCVNAARKVVALVEQVAAIPWHGAISSLHVQPLCAQPPLGFQPKKTRTRTRSFKQNPAKQGLT